MPLFTLSVLARNDLKDIARYTHGRWGRKQRDLYLKQLDDTLHVLADVPPLGVACDHITPGCRKFPHGSHMIYYKEGAAGLIRILRILHKSMDAEPSLSALERGA